MDAEQVLGNVWCNPFRHGSLLLSVLLNGSVNRDSLFRKREYHNKTVYGNKKDAEAHLARTLRDRDTGSLTAGADKRTIGTLLGQVLFFRKGRAPLREAVFASCSLCFNRSTFQDRNTFG